MFIAIQKTRRKTIMSKIILHEQLQKLRKEKGLTQEELAKVFGVTNQAISKWESGTCYPDISLLPEIADFYGINIDILFSKEKPKKNKVNGDNFPDEAHMLLHKFFYDATMMRFTCVCSSDEEQMKYQKSKLANGMCIGCFSNTNGAVIISDTLSFVEREYKTLGSEKIFSQNAKYLRYLSDEKLRNILQYQYKENFSDLKLINRLFSAEEISEKCGYSLADTEDVLDLLILMKLNEREKMANHETKYRFVSQNALYAFVIFKIAEMMSTDKSWLVLRDTSTISDYAFNETQ